MPVYLPHVDMDLLTVTVTLDYTVSLAPHYHRSTINARTRNLIVFFNEVLCITFCCISKSIKYTVKWATAITCNATFLANSGTENPSISIYFVSAMISASLGSKSTTYFISAGLPVVRKQIMLSLKNYRFFLIINQQLTTASNFLSVVHY